MIAQGTSLGVTLGVLRSIAKLGPERKSCPDPDACLQDEWHKHVMINPQEGCAIPVQRHAHALHIGTIDSIMSQ